jgi:prevent-host-death family protein
MKYSEQIKPISYLKSHASEIAKDVYKNGKTYIITQNGEAKFIVQDIVEYEKQQEKIALLKIIGMSEKQVQAGKVIPIEEAFRELDEKIKNLKSEWNTR